MGEGEFTDFINSPPHFALTPLNNLIKTFGKRLMLDRDQSGEISTFSKDKLKNKVLIHCTEKYTRTYKSMSFNNLTSATMFLSPFKEIFCFFAAAVKEVLPNCLAKSLPEFTSTKLPSGNPTK